jgi:hypothetical protein
MMLNKQKYTQPVYDNEAWIRNMSAIPLLMQAEPEQDE